MRQILGFAAKRGLTVAGAIWFWVALNLADWGITMLHLERNGVEANALIADGMGFIVAKLMMPIVIGVVLWRVNRLQWLWFCSAGMLIIIMWNCEWLLLA